MLDSLQATDLIDIALVWLLAWAGIAWLRTSPARVALAGLAILGGIYLVARQLDLVLLTWMLQGFFAVSVLIVVVVFQQELRRLFEQIASLGRLGLRRERRSMDAVDTLVRSLAALAQQRRGALVVIPGHEPLARHLDGGVELGGRVSEPLLLSLFDPNSAGHDGAVLLEADRVARFAIHLPLSANHEQLENRGTRHAAALGLSERTDALCIVVSEERGVVSVATGGRLEALPSAQSVEPRIRDFLRGSTPGAAEHTSGLSGVVGRWREALVALPLVAILWLLIVPGSGEIETERDVAISITGLPAGYSLVEIDPPAGRVRLKGRRRDLLLLDSDALGIRVDAILVELGRRSFEISPDDVLHPEAVEVLDLAPRRVKVSLQRDPEEASASKPPARQP